MSQPECVLRTQSLCDGNQVVDYQGAPGQRCGCWCALIAYDQGEDWTELASAARTHRARTVARCAELQRTAERWTRHSGAARTAPPF